MITVPNSIEGKPTMSAKSASAVIALRAVLAAAALTGATALVAPQAAAQNYGYSSFAGEPAVQQLAQAIENAALAAVNDARGQGLTASQSEVVAAAAVESVIAQSGADSGVVLAALSIAKRDLLLRNDATLTIALNMVSRDLGGAMISPAAPPGHGAPPIGSPPGGGGGGAEYRPPVH
jgi:hypothetical protein